MTDDGKPSALRAAFDWARVAVKSTAILPVAAVTSKLAPECAQRLMRRWAHSCLATLELEFAVVPDDAPALDDPPYLFVHLNQTSLLEAFVFSDVGLPVRMIMNLEFAMIPVLGACLWAMGSAVIVRQRPKQAKARLARVAQEMRDTGWSFGMSVEGYRSPTGELQPFKRGAAVLAIEAGARIVPFYVRGAHRALPMGQWRVRPGKIELERLPPIDTRGMTYDDRRALTDRLRALAEACRDREASRAR